MLRNHNFDPSAGPLWLTVTLSSPPVRACGGVHQTTGSRDVHRPERVSAPLANANGTSIFSCVMHSAMRGRRNGETPRVLRRKLSWACAIDKRSLVTMGARTTGLEARKNLT